MNNTGDELGGRGDGAAAPQRQGQAVLDVLDAWRRLDLDDATSQMADDAVFVPDLLGKPVQGREAVRTLWARYMSLFESYAFDVRNMLISDRLVFVERVETVSRIDGRTIVLPVVSIFELNAAGKIALWRDYWDTSMADVASG